MALGAAGGSEPGEAVPEGNRSPAKVLPGSLPTRPPRENPWRICSGFVSLIISLTSGKKMVAIKLESIARPEVATLPLRKGPEEREGDHHNDGVW